MLKRFFGKPLRVSNIFKKNIKNLKKIYNDIINDIIKKFDSNQDIKEHFIKNIDSLAYKYYINKSNESDSTTNKSNKIESRHALNKRPSILLNNLQSNDDIILYKIINLLLFINEHLSAYIKDLLDIKNNYYSRLDESFQKEIENEINIAKMIFDINRKINININFLYDTLKNNTIINNTDFKKKYYIYLFLRGLNKNRSARENTFTKKFIEDTITKIKNTDIKKYNFIVHNKEYEEFFLPYFIDHNFNFTNKKINKSSKPLSGSYGNVYVNIKNNSGSKIQDYVFKIIKYKNYELYGLLFHKILLQHYKKYNKSQYLCNLYEYGLIINNSKYYAIMENCGINLYKYFGELKEKNSPLTKPTKLIKLIDIFKECCEAVKIIHDMGYLHLDIKPENYMIKDNQIKIIDFGMVKNNNYTTLTPFGTPSFIASDWLINKRNNTQTTLTYHHDIFSLGCMFIQLLYGYVFGEKIEMACPIIDKGQLKNKIINYRASYPELYEEMLGTIQNDCMKNDLNKNIINPLIDVIVGMVNPVPGKRYKSIIDLIKNLNNIQKWLKLLQQ